MRVPPSLHLTATPPRAALPSAALALLVLAAACDADTLYESDARALQLARAPLASGGPALGGLLAKMRTASGASLLLVDTGFPLSGVDRGGCPAAEPRSRAGDLEVLDAVAPSAPLRAAFRGVGLFELCPGPVGDPGTRVGGVLGGDLLSHYSVALALPRDAARPAAMTLHSGLPASDEVLAHNGYAVVRITARGAADLVSAAGVGLGHVSASRPAVRACAAPRAFSTGEPVETCARGQLQARASGTNLLLAISTGHGPLVLSTSAWSRITGDAVTPPDGSEPPLHSPLSPGAVSARWVTLPRLALVDGGNSDDWLGACAELARSRRIEWVLNNQDQKACFQPCDADGNLARTSAAYLELGTGLTTAVVSDTSDLVRALNVDVPPGAQIDGIIGAGTLAGTRVEIDYPARPDGRLTAVCEAGADRQACHAAPRCPRLSGSGQTHICFGLPPRGLAPVCP